ncbi:MAG: MMPL family transporter [Candidatus Hydrogenedens sp.]|nr:MMPL family transporter [Candidatus Hydrogenedens sp.]
MKFSLPEFALRKPVTVVMLSISMLALGGIAWYRMPLKFLPDVDRPFIGVSVPYPNASPQQVEQQIAIPLEGEMRTIPGLRRIRTISDADGCFASLQFSLDTNITQVSAEVRDRMERLKLKLPAEADKMLLQRFSSRSIPVVALGVFRSGDEEQFIHEVRTFIEPQLRRLEGVANIEIITPIQENEILIEFDQDRLESQNLALGQVITAIGESSMNLSLGQIQDEDTKYYVRSVGEYRRIEDIQNLIVSPNGLRLKEIADVTYSDRDPQAHVALDGKGGAVLLIVKESEANTVDVCRRVNKEINRLLGTQMFKDVQLRIFFDQSELILSALNNLFKQGVYGGVMALGVLFFFLHRFRPTIIVALSIPTSLLVAFVFMFFMDMSLNLVTMVSMIIAVGMLVDNAIVVVENIIRHRELGETAKRSAINGAAEVGLAIFAATATTWVVFVPMFYMETGQMSVFMEQLGLPLIVALGGSLVIALTLVPLAMSRMASSKENLFQRLLARMAGSRGEKAAAQGKSASSWFQPVEWVVQGYGKLLDWSLHNRLATMCALAAFGAITYYIPFQSVGMRELPKLDTREIKVDVALEQNYDMAMAQDLFGTVEENLDNWRDELGIKSILTFYELGGGVIDIYLYAPEDPHPYGANPPFVTEDVMKILAQRLPNLVPGATLNFELTDTSESGNESAVSLRMRGDDTAMLEDYANRFKTVLSNIENINGVELDTEKDQTEIQLHIDGALAEGRGVNPEALAMTVQSALRGSRLPFLKQGGREIPVWAQFREEDRESKANLDNVKVLSATGELVPVNQLVEYGKAPAAATIQRVDGKNIVNITARAESDDMGQIKRDLEVAAKSFDLPVGYGIDLGDSLMELDENAFSFLSTMLMAVILIYLVMAALFESYFFPLSILTTVPIALAGAVWALYFTNTQFDSVTLIGCILMAGIIVNNGIVIIDHINQVRRETGTRNPAIIEAGCNRFRPVMMTAITTILGLVPLALATTGGAATFAGLGRALIGGLTVGTVLTLVIVPVFYTFLDDFQRWCFNFFGGILNRGRADADTPSA